MFGYYQDYKCLTSRRDNDDKIWLICDGVLISKGNIIYDYTFCILKKVQK